MFKPGDLVILNVKFNNDFNSKYNLGIIIKVEKNFYKHNISSPIWTKKISQDRLTILWNHNEVCHEPDAYVSLLM